MSRFLNPVDKFHHSELLSEDTEWNEIKKLSPIMPYVYISNLSNGSDLVALSRNSIKVIINVSETNKTDTTLNDFVRYSITHFDIPLPDIPKNITNELNRCCQIIQKAIDVKKNVLIHCTQGVSKAPAVVAFYILKKFYEKHVPETPMLSIAINKMKAKRSCIDINNFYIKFLEEEETNMRKR
jgi:protein-tyrosine phosphatase